MSLQTAESLNEITGGIEMALNAIRYNNPALCVEVVQELRRYVAGEVAACVDLALSSARTGDQATARTVLIALKQKLDIEARMAAAKRAARAY